LIVNWLLVRRVVQVEKRVIWTVVESGFLNGCGVGMSVRWQARCHGIFGMRKVLAELMLFCCEFVLQLFLSHNTVCRTDLSTDLRLPWVRVYVIVVITNM